MTIAACLRVAALASIAFPCCALQCTLGTQGVNFGSYDPFANQFVDGTGNIAVSCDAAAPYTISLSPGSGTYASRTMMGGASAMQYNLFTDATRTTVWGDGTGSAATVSGNAAAANHTVYGRIAPGQNLRPGIYVDAITVVIDF